MPENMTGNEFKKELKGFWYWVNIDRSRPESSWWLSLQDFASMQYDKAYKKEHPKS